jgi:uncharacterized protein
MSQTVKEQIEFLKQLQGIETHAFNIAKKLKNIPVKLEEFDKRLHEFEQDVHKENERIDELKKQYRTHESDLQVNLSKIKKSNEKLGSVKNNKEYQATLKEIDDIKAKNSEIEDHILQCLDLLEETEKRIQTHKRELAVFAGEVEEEKKIVHAESLESQKALGELENEKAQLVAKMDHGFFDQFKRVGEIVGLTAIVRVKDAVCLGCHVSLPPQRYNELQRFECLQYCPSCHRIIYWEKNNERPE